MDVKKYIAITLEVGNLEIGRTSQRYTDNVARSSSRMIKVKHDASLMVQLTTIATRQIIM